jgi:hypothetical protein
MTIDKAVEIRSSAQCIADRSQVCMGTNTMG